jgi:hypothetical protein
LLQQLIRNSESNQSLLAKQCLESMSWYSRDILTHRNVFRWNWEIEAEID